jgi:hypothetical protein
MSKQVKLTPLPLVVKFLDPEGKRAAIVNSLNGRETIVSYKDGGRVDPNELIDTLEAIGFEIEVEDDEEDYRF